MFMPTLQDDLFVRQTFSLCDGMIKGKGMRNR